MRYQTAILFLLAGLLIVGCQSTPVRGVVCKKQHRPAWTQLIQIPTAQGGFTIIPIIHPEQWDIVVQNDKTQGEEGRFLVVVSEEYWNRVEIGDVWQRADTVYEAEKSQ